LEKWQILEHFKREESLFQAVGAPCRCLTLAPHGGRKKEIKDKDDDRTQRKEIQAVAKQKKKHCTIHLAL
jgi:hypothetical protein